jgi:hypothetical protein
MGLFLLFSPTDKEYAQNVMMSVRYVSCCQQVIGCCELPINNLTISQWNLDKEIKIDTIGETCSTKNEGKKEQNVVIGRQ